MQSNNPVGQTEQRRFQSALKFLSIGDASRNDWGSEFQLVGPDAAKVQGQYVDVLVRETATSPCTSCWGTLTATTGDIWNCLAHLHEVRLGHAVNELVDNRTQFVDHPLTDGQPVDSVTRYIGDVVVFSALKVHLRRCLSAIFNPNSAGLLYPLEVNVMHARQDLRCSSRSGWWPVHSPERLWCALRLFGSSDRTQLRQPVETSASKATDIGGQYSSYSSLK